MATNWKMVIVMTMLFAELELMDEHWWIATVGKVSLEMDSFVVVRILRLVLQI